MSSQFNLTLCQHNLLCNMNTIYVSAIMLSYCINEIYIIYTLCQHNLHYINAIYITLFYINMTCNKFTLLSVMSVQ